jgi:hypothetical protein
MKNDSEFSLLEVLITVAALIITTIVISNWLQSRRSAQEAAAVAQLTQEQLDSRFSGSWSSYNFDRFPGMNSGSARYRPD